MSDAITTLPICFAYVKKERLRMRLVNEGKLRMTTVGFAILFVIKKPQPPEIHPVDGAN
jgi:hypothetical protein